MAEEYYKLVRDKIPEIIRREGKNPIIHTASDIEYLEGLNSKLLEETFEYQKSGKPEELADLMEIIYTIADVLGVSEKEMNEIRTRKAEARGKFLERVILERIE